MLNLLYPGVPGVPVAVGGVGGGGGGHVTCLLLPSLN